MIKQLLNSVLPKSRRSIICLCLRHRQINDLLTTDKSRYFARPRPIIIDYYCFIQIFTELSQTYSDRKKGVRIKMFDFISKHNYYYLFTSKIKSQVLLKMIITEFCALSCIQIYRTIK